MNFFKTFLIIFWAGIIFSACKQESETTKTGYDKIVVNDSTITEAINRELKVDEQVASTNIEVTTENGIVLLDGTVNNLLAKNRAREIALMVKGVKGVLNQIDVALQHVNDREIEERINRKLRENEAVEFFEITASSDEGDVELTGAVNSWQEKEIANDIAMGTRGVKSVANNISFVYEEGSRTPEGIKADIKYRFRSDPLLDDANIEITVENSTVILEGSVGSAWEKDKAEVDAMVAGVQSVDASKLEVKSWRREEMFRKDKYVKIPDNELKVAIENGLELDPRVNEDNISIMVDTGVVTLNGEVPTIYAKNAANEVAQAIIGVWDTENNLEVIPPGEIPGEKIKRQIMEDIKWDSYLNNLDISVDVTGETVIIEGTVNSRFEKRHVSNLISRVKGVTKIENNLNVKMDKTEEGSYSAIRPEGSLPLPEAELKSDEEIKNDVMQHLFWSPYVNEEDVNVKVDDGIVTLTGIVETWQEKSMAEKDAYHGGAVSVNNEIEVIYDGEGQK
ncbi:MAG: BON domain-containing protein [Bacteroidales bacterium]